MSPLANRSFLLALLAIGAALGPAARTAIGNSPGPFDKTQSCASKEYQDQSDHEAALRASDASKAPAASTSAATDRNNSTLMVVPGNSEKRLNTTTFVGMGRQITVCVMGLHDWIYVQKKNPISLRLSIGGHMLSNVLPSAIGPTEEEYLNFILHLDATSTDDWKAWAAIVDASHHEEAGGKLPITIALSDSKEFFETSAYTRVVTASDSWYWILALFIVMIGILLYLAATSDLLRYTLTTPPKPPLRSPYSLGLAQMAFWFCLSLAAYVYICLVTMQVHVPMGSVLGLLGISSTTGLAAIFVDKQKSAASAHLAAECEALKVLIQDLTKSTITAGSAAETELLQKKSRLAMVEALLEQSPAETLPATSKGFLNDILSDGESVSFHRFQIAVWTIVLGVVFVWSVYRNITMPEFDASLLTLMGISSGTYLGFKFPEKLKTGDASPAAANTGAGG
jgi:hypothetical protein